MEIRFYTGCERRTISIQRCAKRSRLSIDENLILFICVLISTVSCMERISTALGASGQAQSDGNLLTIACFASSPALALIICPEEQGV